MKFQCISYILVASILGAHLQAFSVSAETKQCSGDLNGDEKVNSMDVSMLQDYLLSAEPLDKAELIIADMNSDGVVNAFDLGLLKARVYDGIDYGTPINASADMISDMREGKNFLFYPSGPWSNGGCFDCGFTSSNITFGRTMRITITDDESGEYNYLSGEYRSAINYHYGYFECSMMPIKADGVDTGFFTYTGPSEGDPWDEIDFEFLGYDTTKVQLNYFTNGVGGHEYMLDLGFDASEGYHTYGFLWLKDSITWYVDGEPRYTVTENIPSTPSKIMVNTWPGIGVDDWLKPFAGDVPLTAKYQWITWTNPEAFEAVQ